MTVELEEDGRVKRAEAQRETRRAHILHTARDVFAKNGYHQTRVSDIIEAASIARGTFYLYFESKAAIFLELVDGLLDELRETMVGVDSSPAARPVREQLLDIVTNVLTKVREHRVLTTILFREAVGLDAEVDAKLREFYRTVHSWIRDSLVDGQAMGVVRDDLDVDAVASFILGSVKYLLEQDMLEGASSVRPAAHIAKELLEYNLRGLLPS
jgi:AcrR family transcriptional regulator